MLHYIYIINVITVEELCSINNTEQNVIANSLDFQLIITDSVQNKTKVKNCNASTK